MRIWESAPAVFERAIPTVEPDTPIVIAGTLLDLPRRDVLLIAEVSKGKVEYVTRDGKWTAFAGYPVLQKMVETPPAEFYRYLFRPCKAASMRLDPLRSGSDLVDVLEVFGKSRFGYALVKASGSFGMITLTDFLSMYGEHLDTDLTVDGVSEPVFSLPGKTGLAKALRELFNRRIRRVRVGGTNSFVSDREILSFVFSPRRLEYARESPDEMLRATLEEVGSVHGIEVEGDTSVAKAASIIQPGTGRCLTIEGGRRVATPWDLVMKPFLRKRLVMGKQA